MEPQAARFTPQLPAATAVLLAVFCGAWFMAAMGWIPATDQPVPAPDAGGPKDRIACGRCGVIESVRQAEKTRNPPGVASLSGGSGGEVMAALHVVLNAMVGNPTGPIRPAPSYEFTVRFHDGSKRTITEPGTPAWKPGDPVKVVNGRIKPDA
jgi:hypothetical protein